MQEQIETLRGGRGNAVRYLGVHYEVTKGCMEQEANRATRYGCTLQAYGDGATYEAYDRAGSSYSYSINTHSKHKLSISACIPLYDCNRLLQKVEESKGMGQNTLFDYYSTMDRISLLSIIQFNPEYSCMPSGNSPDFECKSASIGAS